MATNTYVALDSQTLASTATSVTFTGISQAYTDLVVVVTTSTTGDVYFRINGDTGSNYSQTAIYAYSAFGSTRSTNSTSLWLNYGSNNGNYIGMLQLNNYSNTTSYKTTLLRDGANGSITDYIVGMWRNTNAVTSLTFYPPSTWAVGSTFNLYGIAKEGTTPAPKATGGAIYSDSTYYYHVFAATGVFAPTQSISADMLVIAGGGGAQGGSSYAGGGAGGLLGYTSQSLTATNYTVTVGAGGAGISSGVVAATSGSNSQFGSLTASVGGGGAGGGWTGTGDGAAALSGGSGGGGGATYTVGGGTTTKVGGAGTSGQGFAGGNGSPVTGTASQLAGGGGGGAGAVGSAGSSGGAGGNGGNGSNAYSTWATATGTGVNGYYAGGGAAWGQTADAVGGLGNGGNSNGSAPVRPTANTGGGGNGANAVAGTAGASGVVIVRYAKA